MVIRALIRTLIYFGLIFGAWGAFIYAGIVASHVVGG